MLDEDTLASFNPARYNEIMRSLQSGVEPEIISGFDELGTLFCFAGEQGLMATGFPVLEMSQLMVNGLSTSKSASIAQAASGSISAFLSAMTMSTRCLVSCGALDVLRTALLEMKFPSAASSCVEAIETMSRYRPEEIGGVVGVAPCMNAFPHIGVIARRAALRAISQMCRAGADPSEGFPYMEEFIRVGETDADMNTNIARVVCEMMGSGVRMAIPPGTIAMMINSPLYLPAIFSVSTQPDVISALVATAPDFAAMLTSASDRMGRDRVLGLLVNVLPQSSILAQFSCGQHQRPAGLSYGWATGLSTCIVEILKTDAATPEMTLKALIAVLGVRVPELDDGLIIALLSKVGGRDTPFVTGVLTFFKCHEKVGESGIIPAIKQKASKGQFGSWVASTISEIDQAHKRKNEEKIPGTLDGIVSAIENGQISRFTFLRKGLKMLRSFIGKMDKSKGDRSDNRRKKYPQSLTKAQAAVLGPYVASLLDLVVVPPDDADTRLVETAKMYSRPMQMKFKCPNGQTCRRDVALVDSVAAIEGWYIAVNSNLPITRLSELLEEHSEWRDIIIRSDQSLVSTCQYAVCMRFLLKDQFPGIHIVVDRKKFGSTSSMREVVDLGKRGSESRRGTEELRLGEGSVDEKFYSSPMTVCHGTEDIIFCLQHINMVNNVPVNSNFSARVHAQLRGTVGRLPAYSVALGTIYKAPFLFEFQTRLLAFQLVAYDPKRAIRECVREFGDADVSMEKITEEQFKTSVHRDAIFSDGAMIIRTFAPFPVRLDVSFVGEAGIGQGPTHEFFTAFAHELCRTSRGLFRGESQRDEFAMLPLGLFVSSTAPVKGVELMGTFIAKGLSMGCLMDMAFNPAFFRFVRGRSVGIKYVDAQMAASLSSITAANVDCLDMYMVYPGEGFELIENGSNIPVTADNLGLYQKLVVSHTCGRHMHKYRTAFITGFEKVMSFSALDIFKNEEICRAIIGDSPAFTREELMTQVVISHGFTASCPTVNMFFDVIAGMSPREQSLFIKFVTGYAQLPVGGLAVLRPKLTLARRDFDDGTNADASLPSVLCCTNYLKLPSYSSSEIMRERLLYAITEGQGAFQLS